MAEEDQSQKTEQPTGKRLADAKSKGNVMQSQEVKSWAILLAGTLALMFLAPFISAGVAATARRFIETPHTIPVDISHLRVILVNVLSDVGLIVAPLFALVFFVALAITVVQVGWTFSWEKMKLDPGKFSPIKGLKRMFGARSLVEFGKGLVKTIVLSIVAFMVVVPMFDDVDLFSSFDIWETLDRMEVVAIRIAMATVGIMTVVAVLDFMYQKYDHIKKLKMSKQEVKDETRQAEGAAVAEVIGYVFRLKGKLPSPPPSGGVDQGETDAPGVAEEPGAVH